MLVWLICWVPECKKNPLDYTSALSKGIYYFDNPINIFYLQKPSKIGLH